MPEADILLDHPSALKQPPRPKLLEVMGPGLITGASDDDPSGIATYSQAGAQFGYAVGWTLLFSYPLMCAVQQISAEIGRVTGRGLAGNLRQHMPRWALYGIVLLLLVANTINIGADLGAMGAGLKLLVPLPAGLYIAGFALLTALLEIFVRYSRYVSVLKWLTLSLFAYVATVCVAGVHWRDAATQLVWPHLQASGDYCMVIVAIFGTTISPYLFFWQAEEEVEQEQEDRDARPLKVAPEQAPGELRRIRMDTYIGMGFSNIVALAIVTTAAATLHAHGLTNIQTSAQAAEALKPVAGRFASMIFALGIIGTGLLAVPVLAGSAAYAIGETFEWKVGLGRKASAAKAFYGVIAAAVLVGGLMNFLPVDPIKALFWSAVVNGVVAVPVMVLLMLLASRQAVMGQFKIGAALRSVGWLATGVMALATIGMFATL